MNKKSAVMSTYNKARKAAREGKLDPGRTNRALGIVQSADGGKSKFEKYLTTTRGCTCPDFRQTGKPCKHMIALMIETRMRQAEQPQVTEKKAEEPYTTSAGTVLVAEQKNGSYQIHEFWNKYLYQDYIEAHPQINWVRPSDAKGRRINPDIFHEVEL